MFIRVKPSSNGLHKKVQLVESIRQGARVQQKIVRHIGTAQNDFELEQLTRLAHYVKAQLEETPQPSLFGPESMAELSLIHRQTIPTPAVKVEDLVEESRHVVGISDVYGQVYKALGFEYILPNPARQRLDNDYLRHLTMARIAAPASKRQSVDSLEHTFGISLELDRVYRLMDKLDAGCVNKLQRLSLQHTQQVLALFKEEIRLFCAKKTVLSNF